MRTLSIDTSTARRFVLGRQGLWPGRRWKGMDGLHQAVQEIGSVQVDPLDVVGQNQDLVLASRVDGYRPALLDRALYEKRSLFEWGGNLYIRPTEELRYLLPKIRTADYRGRRALFERSHRSLISKVLKEVETRGPIGTRDLPGGKSVTSYRARRDTGLALYYLWLRGDLMIHSRERGDRRYDLTTRLVPPRLLKPVPEVEAEKHLMQRAMRMYGLPNPSELLMVQRMSSPNSSVAMGRKAWIHAQEHVGRLTRVRVNGWSGAHWVDTDDVSLLESLARCETPKEWAPLSTTTNKEAVFLAPLDIVSARGRSKRLFGFDYVWEVYKPASRRRWGYYVLPILHGETLRARADLKFERATDTLRVLGFWLEDSTSASDRAFARAMAQGLERLKKMINAKKLDVSKIRQSSFRNLVARAA